MLAKVNASAIVGLDALPIEVEVDISSQGLPSFTIVGLPDKAVEEAKERVRSAIRNSGADFPARRITVNLAPADLPKEGPTYDLPIALGILLASEQLKSDIEDAIIVGELSLNGRVRSTKGVLPLAIRAKERGYKRLFIPKLNAAEAAIIPDVTVFPITSLSSLVLHLNTQKLIEPQPRTAFSDQLSDEEFDFDMQDIKGQHLAKRALEIALS
jgi:magnesium chelatase family protein